MDGLDRTDFDILAVLSNDARTSNKELAAKIGLAPSSCLLRVRALVRRGILRGFHADVDPAVLGIGLEALVAIRLARHSKRALDALYGHLLGLREVRAVMNISGPNDVLVHVAVRDVHHLREVIVESFATRGEVDHCETSVIYDVRRNPVMPRFDEPAATRRSRASAARMDPPRTRSDRSSPPTRAPRRR